MTQGTSPNVSSTCLSLHLLRSHLSYLYFFRRLLLPHLTSPTAASSYLLLSHLVFSIPNPRPYLSSSHFFLLNLRNSATTSSVASVYCGSRITKLKETSFYFSLTAIGSNNNRVYNDSTSEQ